MPSININKKLNKIHSENNLLNQKSNLKQLFKHYDLEIENNKRQLELLIDNYNFCYSEEEFLSFNKNTQDLKDLLDNLNYLSTTQDKYINEEHNVVYKINNLNNKKNNLIKNKVSYFDGAKDIKLDIIFEDNILVFFNQNELYFEYEFEESITIKNVLYMNNKIYIHLNYKNTDWIILTSLSHEFGKLNQITYFDDIECFYKINLKYEFDSLVNIDTNKYTFFNKLNKVFYEVVLGKRYYFEYEEYLYFTDYDNFLLNQNKLDTIQLEFLYLYDFNHLCGLSDFVDEFDNKIINTKKIKTKKDLFKLKIDNTKNGIINYLKIKQDEINLINSNNYDITGNFYIINLNENSNYKIIISNTIKNNLFNFEIQLFENNNFIKKINIKTYSSYCYFCNLKFELKTIGEFKEEFNFKEKNLLHLKNVNFIFNDEFYNNKESYEFDLYNNRVINSNDKLLSIFNLNNKFVSNINLLIDKKIINFETLELNFNTKNNLNNLPENNNVNNYINFDLIQKDIKLNKKEVNKEVLKIIKHNFNINIKGE